MIDGSVTIDEVKGWRDKAELKYNAAFKGAPPVGLDRQGRNAWRRQWRRKVEREKEAGTYVKPLNPRRFDDRLPLGAVARWTR